MLPGDEAVSGTPVPAVSLREVEDGDLPLFFAWQADEESFRMAAVPTRDAEAFAAHWARIRSNPDSTLRTIVADGDVVGNVVSWTADEGRMVGYWIGKEHWGRGIATAALVLYLDVDRHRPLLATVVEHNAGSRRVLEKAGFQLVARKLADDGPEPGRLARAALPVRLGSVRAGLLLDELVQLPVRHPEVGVAPAGVLADPVGLDAGGVQLGDRAVEIVDDQPDRALHGAVFLVRRSHREHVAVRRREELCSDAVDGDRLEAEHVPEEGAHLHMSRCVTADEADPADLHLCSPLAVSAILTGERMFV